MVSEEEKNTILDLSEKGFTIKDIARKMGLGFSTVNQVRRENGFISRKRNRKWTKSEEQLLKKLFKEGLSDEEIGEELDRTKQAIYNRRVHNLRLLRKEYTKR